MFQFYAATDQELNEMRGILKSGVYSFQCTNVEQSVSKSGNDMLVLQLKVFDDTGKPHIVKDWLVSTKEMAFKTKHFLESIGLPELYSSGQIDPSKILFTSGNVKTGTRKDDKGNEYPKVIDYVKENIASSTVKNKLSSDNFNDVSW